MGVRIEAISYYLPDEILDNASLSELVGTMSADEIYRRTGVKERHIRAKHQVGSDLAALAGSKLFKDFGVDPSSIDFLFFCTEGLDHKGPATACKIHARLGLSRNCGAMDIPMGCTGFSHGLGLANAMIISGQAKKVLLLASDIPSSVIHPEDYDLRMLFGDAGTATLFVQDPSYPPSTRTIYGTEGEHADKLMVHSSGTIKPVDADWIKNYESCGGLLFGRMTMDAVEVFSFSLRVVPKMVHELLDSNGFTIRDIDHFVFHQANGFMLNVLRRKIGIPAEKFIIDMESYGNTVSASIPIALSNASKSGRIKRGDRVMICGFGIGFAWSGCIFTW